MKVANDASCCLMRPRVVSSLSSPVFSSNFAAQLPMKISGLLSAKASRNIIDLRRSYCTRAPPTGPGETDCSATGLPAKGWFASRDTQSIAFFRPPGMLKLYIGVVERKVGKGWSGLDGHAVGGERRQQPLHHGVEGPFAERAADRDNIQGGHDNLQLVYESIKARTATSSADAALTAPRTACGRGVPYFSFSIGFTSTPTPSMSISQVSPCFIHTGFGLRAWPTPEGVPVKTISPGSSVMPCVT